MQNICQTTSSLCVKAHHIVSRSAVCDPIFNRSLVFLSYFEARYVHEKFLSPTDNIETYLFRTLLRTQKAFVESVSDLNGSFIIPQFSYRVKRSLASETPFVMARSGGFMAALIH